MEPIQNTHEEVLVGLFDRDLCDCPRHCAPYVSLSLENAEF
jgi:hypothetical protein